jgi:soluble lytic murein transglycosylase-like protein
VTTSRLATWIALAVTLITAALILLAIFALPASAGDVPRQALAHRSALIRAARSELGLAAPVATLAAQVHTESRWREDARSAVGAQGLGQIMPDTATWLGEIRPDLGLADAWNPGWALRALCAYDAWLLDRIRAASARDRWQMTLASYNGGLGWLFKDRALAARSGLDPGRWDGQVAVVNAGRSKAAWRENRDYPRQVQKFEPLYASWGPGVLR